MTGDSGTGKSHLSKALFLSAPTGPMGVKLAIDPSDSELLDRMPGFKDFHDPYAWPEIGPLARFVPRDPYALDVYGVLYGRALRRGRVLILCDEQGIVMPSRGGRNGDGKPMGTARECLAYVTTGRKRLCGHLGCHIRPVDVDPRATSVVQHVIGFDLPLPEDRKRFAQIAGIPPAEIDVYMGQLERGPAGTTHTGFIWSNRRERTVTLCPPVTS